MAKTVRCESCGVRPATKDSPEGRLCKLCLELAGWENTHSDNGHDEEAGHSDEQMADETAGCWVCHPELDQTQREYTERAGTSRMGIVMHVTRTATGKEKASQVAAQLPESFTATYRTRQGKVVFSAKSAGEAVLLTWSVDGAFLGGTFSTENKIRNVRNVAEALRLVA